jgi:DNA-binding MarR family transcriptional regulator
MDSIKEAFQKVKEDMDFLKREIDFLREDLGEMNKKFSEISSKLDQKEKKEQTFSQDKPATIPTHKLQNSAIPTHNPTHNLPFKPLKPQNLPISTGNGGVPTDRQTDRQTDQHTENSLKTTPNQLENASELLDSLDSIKKEIRLKFKGITEQELLVFSTIYQFDEEQGFSDYKILSKRLNLTESSIRDYVGKLIKKGIPVDKKRINNKNIQLSVSPNLKKIASLSAILRLREL